MHPFINCFSHCVHKTKYRDCLCAFLFSVVCPAISSSRPSPHPAFSGLYGAARNKSGSCTAMELPTYYYVSGSPHCNCVVWIFHAGKSCSLAGHGTWGKISPVEKYNPTNNHYDSFTPQLRRSAPSNASKRTRRFLKTASQ
jgi:hypothetical protein